MPTINVLSDADTAEVSLVGGGANFRRRFAVAKDDVMTYEQIMKAVLETEVENEDQLEELAKEGKLPGKAVAALKAALRVLQAHKDVLPSNALKILAKLAEFPFEEEETDMDKTKKNDESTTEEKIVPKATDATLDLADVPDSLRPTIEALQKSKIDQDAQVVELRKSLDAETEKRVERDLIERIEKEAPNAPGATRDKIVALLKKADTDEDRDVLFSILKAASETVGKSELLKQRSHGGNGEDSAAAQLESITRERIAKSDGKGSWADTYDTVIRERPDLYNQYLSENPAQSGR